MWLALCTLMHCVVVQRREEIKHSVTIPVLVLYKSLSSEQVKHLNQVQFLQS